MTTNLTTSELDRVTTMRLQARAGQIGYWQIYSWLADTLKIKGVASSDQTVLWLRGATEANAGRGAMSEIIRSYSAMQYQLRYGTSLPTSKMQEASNAVAENLIKDLLGENLDWPGGQVPDIDRIAESDAKAVGDELFGPNLSHDQLDSAFANNSAWSGCLLFSLLRSDQTNRLMRTGNSSQIDTMNDIRDVLYAFVSYTEALKSARLQFLLESAPQKAVDTIILGHTLTSYFLGPGTLESLFQAAYEGTDNPVLRVAFSAIASTGVNKFLDMLMGAVQGKPLLGTTTDANFGATARAFFNLTPAQLQSLQIELLTDDAGTLASRAATDVNVRAALGALSIVKVVVVPSVAQGFALYDETTGAGVITKHWMADRAAMVSWVAGTKALDNGAITQQTTVSAPTVYKDIATGRIVRVTTAGGSVSVAATTFDLDASNVVFGSDGNDTGTGGRAADHLYGGAGNDTLLGQAGNDHLEGNAGDDRLDGGAGDDTLLGGAGIDTYVIDANTGSDTVIDSDGQGRIVLAGLTLTGAGKLVAETADYAVWNDTSQPAAPITYRLDKAGRTLTISRPGNTVIVQNFSAGNLGISVPAKTVPPAPPQQTTFNLLNKADYDAYTLNPQANPASHLINAATAYDSQFDAIWVNSLLPQQTGVAHVFAPSVAGTGYSDLIEAGPGNAIQRIVISGRGGDDSLFGSTASTLDAAVARGETDAPSGKGWLWLEGGQGSSGGRDLVAGAAGDDVITAGTGDDTLSGGAGSDVIITDIEGLPFKTSGVDTMFTRWMTGQNNVATGAGPTLPVLLATYETADGARRTTSFASITVDPLQALDLSGLYAMRVQDLPGYSTNPAGPYRTYADLNGAGQNGYGSSVGGNDLVYGGAGNDAINVGAGKDTVFAGSGDDLAAGYDGDDFIDGGAGNDWLAGDYWAFAGNGRQPAVTVAVAGAAAYTLRATLDPARHGSDYIAGGAGNDLATSPRMMHSLEVGTAQ